MKHLGDISKVNGASIAPVDIITFGSPCQDLSVAGKQAGLDGSRSGLFREAVRIIKEMRDATNGKQPRFAIWENVPGAFSSNKGADFQTVLHELCKITEPKAPVIAIPKAGWPPAGQLSNVGGDASLGGLSTHNFTEYPNAAVESSLSAILQDNVPENYSLSPEACQGILRRAFVRGKPLPEPLLSALIAQSMALPTKQVPAQAV